MLADKHLVGDADAWSTLVHHYGGNGLALKIVGETIRHLYASDIAAFVANANAAQGAVFRDIRRLLDARVERLSALNGTR